MCVFVCVFSSFRVVVVVLLLFRSVHSAHVCPRRERMQVTETNLHGSVPVH